MTNRFLGFGIALVSVMAASAAHASDDRNGATQILRGDYAGAERIILTQQRMFPRDADLMLNLASVYRHTGRMDDARALYQAILAAPDDSLDLPGAGGTRSSHVLAQTALSRMAAIQLSAR